MSNTDLSLTIGGPQGGGIDSSANMISRAFASSGYNVFGVREYHSNIKGRHSYTHLRVKEERPRSLKYPLNVLVALDADTVFEHLEDVAADTKVIYDKSFESSELSQARMITKITQGNIKERLDGGNFSLDVKGALDYMESKGARLIGVSFSDLVTRATSEGTPARYFNTLGAAITLSIMGVDIDSTKLAIEAVFTGKDKVIVENKKVVDSAYAFTDENHFNGIKLPKKESVKRLLLNGNDGSAIGKLMGGLRFQTYYPITPASDESSILENHETYDLLESEKDKLRKGGVVVVQTEDELGAITMASGAALTGARSSTATSGPGFSLMAEAISFAGMDEIPIVVTLYQRGGPSTGLPTRNGQSDLLFALNTGHGEFPRIVLSSGDVEECIYDAMKALNYAERYQMPVIHLIDKNLANTLDLIPTIDIKKVKVPHTVKTEESVDAFRRYNIDVQDGISEMGVFGKDIFWMTGDEHDELGHVTEDTKMRDRQMEKRFKKLETAESEIPMDDRVELLGDKSANITFVTWGSQKGPMLDVLEDLEKEGIKANLLSIRMFEPFPVKFVKDILKSAMVTIDVESNMLAQAARVIELHTGIEIENKILKYNGRHMTEDEILNAAKEIISKKTAKVVLQNGA